MNTEQSLQVLKSVIDAAIAAGLVTGDLYTGIGLGFDDFLHIVH